MNEWEGGRAGEATEARTVLGPVSTICGSDVKIALYIYIQTVYTHYSDWAHTLTHTHGGGSQVAALQRWSIWKSTSRDATPALQHCSHSLYLGEQQQKKNALHLQPFFTDKECERVRHGTDVPFVPLWAPLCTLLWRGCNWLCFGDDLLMNYALKEKRGGGELRRKRVLGVS